jgi:NADH dehydrogenase
MSDSVDVLVLGGGYSGLWGAANAADVAREKNAALKITLVSDHEHLIHRPRLYEKNPDAYRIPLKPLLDPLGIVFLRGHATTIDTTARTVIVRTSDGEETLHYKRLVLATGSVLSKVPIPGADRYSWNIDSYPAAKAFDDHLRALSRANEPGSNTFIVIGAGMCGIELVTELRDRLKEYAGEEASENSRIILVERGGLVGPLFGDEPRPVIEEALAVAGVEVRLSTEVTRIEKESVTLSTGEIIPTRTVVLTVGMRANDLTAQIPGERDKFGRLFVDETLRVKGVPDIFASGDVAHAKVDGTHSALMACQNSQTMGKYAGRNVAADLLGAPFTKYSQADYTTCLDLGRFGALYTEGFDRKLKAYGDQIGVRGETAKQRKRRINGKEIYPPAPGPAEAILAGFRIDSRGR